MGSLARLRLVRRELSCDEEPHVIYGQEATCVLHALILFVSHLDVLL